MARVVTKKVGTKIAVKVGTKVAVKAAQMGAKYAMLAVTGPAGWAAAAAMLALEVMFMVLDLIDADGYDSYTSNSLLEDMRSKIIGTAYSETIATSGDNKQDWPTLFPITEIATLDEFYGSVALADMLMRENYGDPNINFDPVAGPLNVKYNDDMMNFYSLLFYIDPRNNIRNDPNLDPDMTLFELINERKLTMGDILPILSDAQIDLLPNGFRISEGVEALQVEVIVSEEVVPSPNGGMAGEETILNLRRENGRTATLRPSVPEPDSRIADYHTKSSQYYHKERDVYLYEILKAVLKRSSSPERADMLDLVPFMSTPYRYGITITPEAATEWNTKSAPLWRAYNDLFTAGQERPENYLDPMSALYTDTYYIIDPTDPYTGTIPNLIEQKLSQKTVLSAPYGPLMAYCLNTRRVAGLAGVSPSVSPEEFGVTFDMENVRCNYTEKFCDRYGLEFVNNDCRPYPGMGVAEMIFGATLTKGVVRTYKSYVVDNIESGKADRVALGLFYATIGVGSMAVDAIFSRILEDTVAKGSNIINKRSCKEYGDLYRDDGTSCWLDTIPVRSSITKKYDCSDWEKNSDGTPGKRGNYTHDSLDDDKTSCWQHTLPLKSSITKKKDCANWGHKYGTNLRDDGTSCWQDTLMKEISVPSLKSCDDWKHKYGSALDDDDMGSCWLHTIMKKTDTAKTRDCKGEPLKDLNGDVIPGKYKWRDQVTLADGTVVGEGRGKLRDDGTSCWKDIYAKKTSAATKVDCEGPPIRQPDGSVIENKFKWRDQVTLNDGTVAGEGLGTLIDDGTSCWNHVYAKESSPAELVGCDGMNKDGVLKKNWGKKYGKLLEDDGVSCWLHAKGRGAGKLPECPDGEEQKGLLCYPKCRRDAAYEAANDGAPMYRSRALECEGRCPNGTENNGFFCTDWIGTYTKPLTQYSCSSKSVDANSTRGKALLAANGGNTDSLKHKMNIFGTCYEPCMPGTSLKSTALGSGFCNKVRNRYTRAGKAKPLRVCGKTGGRTEDYSEKDGAICYKTCPTVDELDDNNNPIMNDDGTKKQRVMYDGIGPVCWPKGGAGIKVTTFERGYCEESDNKPGVDRDNLGNLGVCWDYCKKRPGETERDNDIGLLCEPRVNGKISVGIKKTLIDRVKDGCGPVSDANQLPETHPDYPRMRKNIFGVCWDVCKDGDDDWGALCNPKGGFGIKKNLFQRYYCEDENKTNVLGVCWEKCPKKDPDDPNKTWYEDIGALCHPMGPGPNENSLLGEGPGIKVPVWDREVCGHSEYQPPECEDLYEGKLDETLARLEAITDRESEQFRTGVGVTAIIENLTRDGFTGENAPDLKLDLEDILGCPRRRKNVAGICWDRCPPSETYGVDYTDIGALCHPKGGPGIRVPVWDREICGPKANQPNKCKIIYDDNRVATVKALNDIGETALASKLESEGYYRDAPSEKYPEGKEVMKMQVETALGCPERRDKLMGVCWDDCPDEYDRIGALCQPKDGPGIKVPVWEREHCGTSSSQSDKCKDVAALDVPRIKEHLANVDRGDISDRIDEAGELTPEIYTDVEGALSCPEYRRKLMGICWDTCPGPVVPRNKEKVLELRERYNEEKPLYDEAFETYTYWQTIISSDDGTLPRERLERPIISRGNGLKGRNGRSHLWSGPEIERYNTLLSEYLEMKEAYTIESGSRDLAFEEPCLDGFFRSAADMVSMGPRCTPEKGWHKRTAVTEKLEELQEIYETRKASFEPLKMEYESELASYTTERSFGYKTIGVLCEPKGGTDDVTGKETKAGPGIKVLTWERDWCRPDQTAILGICWDKCKEGYRDDGALCTVDPNYTFPPTVQEQGDDGYQFDFRDQMGLDEIQYSQVSYVNEFGEQVVGTETAQSLAEITLERQASRDFLNPNAIRLENEASLEDTDPYFELTDEEQMSVWQDMADERQVMLDTADEGTDLYNMANSDGFNIQYASPE